MHKIYKENFSGNSFVFESDELKKSFYGFLLKNNKDERAYLTREVLYDRLGEKLGLDRETVHKHISGDAIPDKIEVVYGYGEFLKNGNKYAFLRLKETGAYLYRDGQDISAYSRFAEYCVKAIYAELIRLISEFSESNGFNDSPDGGDALIYYRRRVDKIESMAKQLYGHNDLRDELLSITRSIKKMICTCEIPGVPESWYLTNPDLRFYTAGFGLIAEAPEFYEKLKNGQTVFYLDYYPEDYELELCYEYFSALYRNNEENNFHYNYYDFFQQELINTIELLFEKQINGYLKDMQD